MTDSSGPDQATRELAEAARLLAEAALSLSDADLGQPYRWLAHNEGARFALIGPAHELRALAVALAAERRHAGRPLTRAQHALGQYHAAYRDLEAVMLGVTAVEYDASPAPGEWSLRYVYSHMVGAERNFFALVHYGARRQREADDLSPTLPDGEADRLFGPFSETFLPLMETGAQTGVAAFHTAVHDRALAEFAALDDVVLDGPSLWWEGEPYTLEYRLHRFEAHLRQHTVQAERTLDQLGRPANEARRLIRLLFAALAEAEASVIGAPEIGVAARAETAAMLRRRAAELTAAVAQAQTMIAAVKAGDRPQVEALLAEDPNLAAATDNGVPVVRVALYYNEPDIAELLAGRVEELEIWDAAALGRLGLVQQIVAGWGGHILNQYSRDGFTPLQLACFFGHEDVAAWLIKQGADVNALSRNPLATRPLRAAVAGNHLGIAHSLLAAGADPTPPDAETPLGIARESGNEAMIELLLGYGASA